MKNQQLINELKEMSDDELYELRDAQIELVLKHPTKSNAEWLVCIVDECNKR